MSRASLVVLLVAVALPGRAHAHALEPGFLEVEAVGTSDWRVTWRIPQDQGSPLPLEATLPDSCEPRRGPAPAFDGRAFATRWLTSCKGGLGGGTIRIEGLESTRTDILVRYSLEVGGVPQLRRLTATDPSFVVPAPRGKAAIFASYLRFGIDHILSGIDHLLFVFALLLLVREASGLVAAITAFTVAHSISLGMATLGWLVVASPPVEAVVALSIVTLAAELAQPAGRGRLLTERSPWAVSLCFGLLHGLAFAGALIETGLPQGDVPLALLAFNLGVEAGQLLFIGAVLAAGLLLSRLRAGNPLMPRGSRLLRATAYGIGTLSAFWMFERIARFRP